MAGDGDVVGLALGDAGGDGTDADLGDEFHRDERFRVRVLQVVDRLRQVLDRVDVVMRRRRDQLDAGRRVAQLGDVFGDFAPGQLAAFARLRALRDFDLQHLGARQVLGGDAEAARSDLLDLGLERVACAQGNVDFYAAFTQPRLQRFARLDRRVAPVVLAALARVRAPADAIHGDGERGVRLGRDRAQRHGAGGEALDDLRCGLDLLDRHGLALVEAELEQAAERHVPARLVVDQRRIFLIRRGRIRARRVLQLRDRIRRPGVVLAAHAPGVFAARVEHGGEDGVALIEGGAMHAQRLVGDLEYIDALDVRR